MQREITQDWVLRQLPPRPQQTNKGSFGTVLAVAGSMAYRGAAALCTEGALRSGAGLVYLAAVEPVLQLALLRTPECCACGCRTDADGCIHPQDAAALRRWFSERDAVLLAGPGLGQNAGAVCKALLGRGAAWRAAVWDADALNALTRGEWRMQKDLPGIITPHPGEAARLLGTDAAAIQADREGAARELAQRFGCVAVLKGSGTLVAEPEGTVWHNATGNAGLARGGSGDVLAGMIAALLAQGLIPAAAACCGVWLHGAAADRCAKRRSQLAMLPHDILEDLGTLLAEAGR